MPNNELFKYAGMATQFLVTLGVTIFIGFKVDQRLHTAFPWFTLLLPLLVLAATFYQVYKETNTKK